MSHYFCGSSPSMLPTCRLKRWKELKRKIIKERKKFMKVVYNWNDYLLLWMVSFYASNLQAEVSMQYVCIYIYVCVCWLLIFLKMDGIGNNILYLKMVAWQQGEGSRVNVAMTTSFKNSWLMMACEFLKGDNLHFVGLRLRGRRGDIRTL